MLCSESTSQRYVYASCYRKADVISNSEKMMVRWCAKARLYSFSQVENNIVLFHTATYMKILIPSGYLSSLLSKLKFGLYNHLNPSSTPQSTPQCPTSSRFYFESLQLWCRFSIHKINTIGLGQGVV